MPYMLLLDWISHIVGPEVAIPYLEYLFNFFLFYPFVIFYHNVFPFERASMCIEMNFNDTISFYYLYLKNFK